RLLGEQQRARPFLEFAAELLEIAVRLAAHSGPLQLGAHQLRVAADRGRGQDAIGKFHGHGHSFRRSSTTRSYCGIPLRTPRYPSSGLPISRPSFERMKSRMEVSCNPLRFLITEIALR